MVSRGSAWWGVMFFLVCFFIGLAAKVDDQGYIHDDAIRLDPAPSKGKMVHDGAAKYLLAGCVRILAIQHRRRRRSRPVSMRSPLNSL